jgi:hypothetical protein
MKRFLNLRMLLVVMMALATIMTLLGGIGSTCVAFNAEQYPPLFSKLVPYKPILQILVYVSILVGAAMIWVTYWTARANKWFFLSALITLIGGGGAAAVQMYYSSSVRGIPFFSAAPTNIRLYITLAALIVFVLIRFTPWWNKIGSPSNIPGSPMAAGGASLIVTAIVILTTPFWAGDSHIIDGYNFILALETPLLVDGIVLLMIGIGMVAYELKRKRVNQTHAVTIAK